METLRLNSTGPTVELLQSTLKKIGYYPDSIDGIFGYKTNNSVISFQKNFSLVPDGIVGPNTWNALMPYINGYTTYTVKEGDTLYKLADFYSTTVDAILIANPTIEIDNIQIGEQVIVPFSYCVPTNINYTSEVLNLNISSFKTIYPFLNISSIGNSVLGNNIPVITFGNGSKSILYCAATHANEWITSTLLMKFLENLSKSYVNNLDIFGQNARYLYEKVTLKIIPMINPDGVNLVTGFYNTSSKPYIDAQKIANDFKDIPFPSGWKANIERGEYSKYPPPFFPL